MEKQIAYILIGHSHYDDELWEWLNRNIKESDSEIMCDTYDYMSAWGILILAGCNIIAMKEADGVQIYYDKPIDTLIKKLDEIIR